MVFVTLCFAVALLPIQTLMDDLPKGPAGLNFQNIITLVCLVGWYLLCQRFKRPLIQPLGDHPGNKLNKRLGQYVVLSYAALWYGKLFHMALVDWPVSMADERFIHWKDECTGILLYFVIAAVLKDEKQMKRLVVAMFVSVPYIMGVYYVARNADSVPTNQTLICPEPSRDPRKDECDFTEDDKQGSLTGKPYGIYADLDMKEGSWLVSDEKHPLKVYNEDGDLYPAKMLDKTGRILISGYDRFSRKPLYARYHQGVDPNKFSWAQKEVRGVFVQVGTNEMGSWYAHAMMFAVGILMCYRPLPWILYLLPNIMFLGYGVIYSLSRAAWLAVGAGFGYLGARRSKAMLITFVAFLLVAPAFLGGAVSDRGGQGKDESAAHRLDFWKWAAYAGIVRYPVIGLGYQCYIPKHREETGIKLDTHNFFFRTLCELGPVGLFLIFSILWASFRLAWGVYEDGHTPFIKGVGLGTSLMIIACALGNMFGDRFSYISLNSWIFAMLGMTVRSRVWIDEHRAREGQERAAAAKARIGAASRRPPEPPPRGAAPARRRPLREVVDESYDDPRADARATFRAQASPMRRSEYDSDDSFEEAPYEEAPPPRRR